jgi:hypothetical protein
MLNSFKENQAQPAMGKRKQSGQKHMQTDLFSKQHGSHYTKTLHISTLS